MLRALGAAMVLALMTVRVDAQQHSRLFPPAELGMLEGSDRDLWQRPERIMDALYIGEGSVVADLGAGGGWFTVRLASRVGPNGIVYAEDIQELMIRAIEGRVHGEGLRNVRVILGTASDARLPERAVDAVLIVDAYNEMEQPTALLRSVARALKPSGLIGIVDFKLDGGGPGPAIEERVHPERVIRDAEAAGLEFRRRETFLRYQYMLIFGLPSQ
jgi:ubiquinone/menaquinone biosynthesis C-methylase UbiE